MSKSSRSPSVEIVPPSNSLAGVMNAAFNNNDRDSEDELRDDDADAEAEEDDHVPAPPTPAKPAPGTVSNILNASSAKLMLDSILTHRRHLYLASVVCEPARNAKVP